MILRAAEDLGIDLGRSVLVGDKRSDVEAGRCVGCSTILLSAPPAVSESWVEHVAHDWNEVMARIHCLEEGRLSHG